MTEIDVTSTAFAVDVVATTDIDAPADRVWAVLADTTHYPEWNPFVRSLEGPLVAGGRIAVGLQLPGRKLQAMRPALVSVEDGRGFSWLGHVGFPGVFDGRHRFTVEPLGESRSRFVQAERLSGVLVPAFRSMLTGPTPEAFVAMNDALAKRVLDA